MLAFLYPVRRCSASVEHEPGQPQADRRHERDEEQNRNEGGVER
jgi:hypothetical protein